MTVEVLDASAITMYLGRALSLTEVHEKELEHRTKKAWSRFGMYKQEMMQKEVSLKCRLRLFHAVVTPTMLYACSAWALTAEREQKIRSAQLRMLRMLMGRKRRRQQGGQDLEAWVD